MAHNTRRAGAPALLSGTSSEYLGRRAPPRILRERAVVLLLGDVGVGKSTVAGRLAETLGPLPGRRQFAGVHRLDAAGLQDAIAEYVATRKWSDVMRNAGALVLDGPTWLHARPAQFQCLLALLKDRAERGRRTFVCQGDDSASLSALMRAMEPGSLATIALRFPKGPQGRLRFARRVCDELRLPRSAARGTEDLTPWGYDAVIRHLRAERDGKPARRTTSRADTADARH